MEPQLLHTVRHLRPGGQEGVYPRSAGYLHFSTQGVAIIKEDKVGPGVPVHIGIVPGAQLPGEEHGGTQSVHLLAQLLPDVESFQAETQRLRDATDAAQRQRQCSEKEVADLQAELQEERNFSFQQRAHISALESRCRKAEKLLKRFPLEVVREVEKRETQAERPSK